MTRINLIPPSELSDAHLLAEHREIVRIPNQVRSGKLSSEGAPESFKLGKGHVKFFVDRLYFLKNRYLELYIECRARGFNVKDMYSAFKGLPNESYWMPTEEDIRISRERIQEKLNQKPGFYKFTPANR